MTRTLEFDPDEAIAPGEQLRITIWSNTLADNDPDQDHPFIMGALKTLHMHNVPTKTESIWHLEELTRKYAKWVAAQRQKSESGDPGFFKFKKGDPSEAVLENVGEVEESSSEEGHSDASLDSDVDADGSLNEGPPPSKVTEEDEDDPTQVRPSAWIAHCRPHQIPHHRHLVPARTTPRCSTTSPRTLSASSCPMSPVPLPTRSLTVDRMT